MGCDDLVLVEIEDSELDSPHIVSRQFVQNRCQSLAMTSPGREEFHKNSSGEREDLLTKGGVGDEYRSIREKEREPEW